MSTQCLEEDPKRCQCCTKEGHQCTRAPKIGIFCTQHSHGCKRQVIKKCQSIRPKTNPSVYQGAETERKIRQETERKALQETERRARQQTEQKAKQEIERKDRQETERRAKQEIERKDRQEAERKAQQETERKMRQEAERKAQQETERKMRQEAERKARQETERKMRQEAERKMRQEAERKARQETERKMRQEVERKARQETERKMRQEAERKARQETERKMRQEAERKARQETERKMRQEAERKARQETERKMRQEAERKARQETEPKMRQEMERRGPGGPGGSRPKLSIRRPVTVPAPSIELHPPGKGIIEQPSSKDLDAIVTLCMLKDHYVVGACIMAFAHRYLIRTSGRKIQLVIMCDDYIYRRWEPVLSQYFDRVIKIELFEIKLTEQYRFASGKYDWMKYALNKWQCLQLTEYRKVLFIDVDTLPVSRQFYQIFDYETPAFYFRIETGPRYQTKCTNNEIVREISKEVTYSQLIHDVSEGRSPTIDAGLCLLTPSKKDYQDYRRMVEVIYKDGMYSSPGSGPDETSLLYTYLTKMWSGDGTQIHKICDEYNVIPWDMPKMVDQALLYNFLAYYKPWAKGRYMQWDEELLWSDLLIVMHPPSPLINLYQSEITKTCEAFFKLSPKEQGKYFDRMKPPLKDCTQIGDPRLIRQRRTYRYGQQYGPMRLKDLIGIFRL